MSVVVCTDLDRTLLDEDGRIHPQDKEILQTRQDIQFVLATGRPLHSVKKAFHKNGMFQDCSLPFALAGVNGSVTYKAGERLNEYFPFTPSVRERLFDLTQRFSAVTWWFYEIDEVYMRWPNPFGQQVVADLDMICKTFTCTDDHDRFSKLVGISGDPNLLREAGEQASHLPVEIMYGLGFFFEVNPRGVNKGSGVLSLLSSPTNGTKIFAAGDDENDLPLLSLADRSFCPLTANPHIYAMVDQVIDKTERGLLTPILEQAGAA
jgi:HAD superfamily hydrolase (TIGR01484 family)